MRTTRGPLLGSFDEPLYSGLPDVEALLLIPSSLIPVQMPRIHTEIARLLDGLCPEVRKVAVVRHRKPQGAAYAFRLN